VADGGRTHAEFSSSRSEPLPPRDGKNDRQMAKKITVKVTINS
jgi:hypothetical protein